MTTFPELTLTCPLDKQLEQIHMQSPAIFATGQQQQMASVNAGGTWNSQQQPNSGGMYQPGTGERALNMAVAVGQMLTPGKCTLG
jgi:hypothetical protein